MNSWEKNALYDYFHAVELDVSPRDWCTPAQFAFARGWIVHNFRRMFRAMCTVFPMAERQAAGFAYRHSMAPSEMVRAFTNWMIARRPMSCQIIIKASDGLTRMRIAFFEFMHMRDDYEDNRYDDMPWMEDVVSDDDEN